MTRKIAPVEINGKLVLIEVEDIEIVTSAISNTHGSGLGGNYEDVSADDPVILKS